jgi:DNA-binding response OmpR family regulator
VSAEVLIVDDEQPIVSVLTRSLAARGYIVRAAATDEDALIASPKASDAMLLDINLPDITGKCCAS